LSRDAYSQDVMLREAGAAVLLKMSSGGDGAQGRHDREGQA
jgi:hypothetical protein